MPKHTDSVRPICVVYETASDHPGLNRLLHSLRRWGWDHNVVLDREWRGFGRRLKEVVKVCGEFLVNRYTHAIHLDARDVVAVGPASEFVAPSVPLLLASERGCWPDWNRIEDYPPCPHPWKFCHSQYVIDLHRLDLLEADGLDDGVDDQRHLTNVFFKHNPAKDSKQPTVAIDYDNEYVSACAFCDPNFLDWYEVIGNRVRHRLTNSMPKFIHGNSRMNLDWLPTKEEPK